MAPATQPGLISATFAQGARPVLPHIRAAVGGHGAPAILETLHRHDRMIARHPASPRCCGPTLRRPCESSPTPTVCCTAQLELFERLLDDEARAGEYAPPQPIPLLAYAL